MFEPEDLITYRRRGLAFWRSRDRMLKDGGATALVRSRPSKHSISEPTRTQQYFIDWNAERLGITPAESRERYVQSWNAIPNGHSGKAFGKFHGHCYDVFKVFADDSPREVMSAYQIHGHVHFLTMLTYPEPRWFDDDAIVKRLKGREQVSIVDFGCGLAQQSRTLAEYLRDQGIKVRLALADIPTVRKDFLLWWGRHTGIPTTFLECTLERPIPDLPRMDVCFALEFFEHVYDPAAYFTRIDAAMNGGGLLVTNIGDHHRDFMHVSPKLGALRDAVAASHYEEVFATFIYQKPMHS
ncbi:MAG: methyltransferase domain-containing protein [Steroidobacteraceae bacterium]|jgi:SAM-dependent methyltransferase